MGNQKKLRELEAKVKDGFRDKFPCHPDFFEFTSSEVDLKSVDLHKLALETNQHLVLMSKKGEFARTDVPFERLSEVAGGKVQIKILSKAIRDIQTEMQRLAVAMSRN